VCGGDSGKRGAEIGGGGGGDRDEGGGGGRPGWGQGGGVGREGIGVVKIDIHGEGRRRSDSERLKR